MPQATRPAAQPNSCSIGTARSLPIRQAATLYEFWDAELRDAVTKLAVPEKAQKIAGKFRLPEIAQELSHPSARVFGASPEAARDALLLQSLQAAE